MLLARDAFDAIRRHGEQAYPEECCGFLLGRSSPSGIEAHAIHRSDNRRSEFRERRYLMSPEDYLTAERRARETGLDVVGFYHSHPDHPARPSSTDLQEATFPGFVYVIASIREGAGEEITAWSLVPDRSRFEEEQIALIEMRDVSLES